MDEKALVQRAIGGDSAAFGTLVERYQQQVFNLALRMVGSRADAEDLAQEAFIRAWRALPSFHQSAQFSTWLYRLTSNICIDFLRSRGRKPTVSLTVEGDDEESEELDVADERYDPEENFQRAELQRAVQRGLNTLPEEFRTILILRELEGLSYAEIGEMLHLEEGTVKSRLFRARSRLCEFLKQDGNLPDAYASKTRKGGAK